MEVTVSKINRRRERNPLTYARHRKEVFWQISLPLAIGSLILLAFAGLSLTLEAGEISRWADISLVWMIAPIMLVILITFAMLVVSIYVTVKLIEALPYYSLQLLNGLILIGRYMHQAENRAVEPFVRLKTFSASARALGRQITWKSNRYK